MSLREPFWRGAARGASFVRTAQQPPGCAGQNHAAAMIKCEGVRGQVSCLLLEANFIGNLGELSLLLGLEPGVCVVGSGHGCGGTELQAVLVFSLLL